LVLLHRSQPTWLAFSNKKNGVTGQIEIAGVLMDDSREFLGLLVVRLYVHFTQHTRSHRTTPSGTWAGFLPRPLQVSRDKWTCRRALLIAVAAQILCKPAHNAQRVPLLVGHSLNIVFVHSILHHPVLLLTSCTNLRHFKVYSRILSIERIAKPLCLFPTCLLFFDTIK
jgi:hypothetical protein